MRSRFRQGFVFVWTIFLLSQDCGLAAEEKPARQAEWKKIMAAAEKEGQAVIYSTAGLADTAYSFPKVYPKIKVVTATAGSGAELSNRIMTERRAGKYLADIYLFGPATHVTVLYPAKALDPIRAALILPEVTDESRWWKGTHHYAGQKSFPQAVTLMLLA